MRIKYPLLLLTCCACIVQAQVPVILKDINTYGDGVNYNTKIIEWNGKIYFNARDSAGFYLWKSDGTDVGTEKIDFGSRFNSPLSERFIFQNQLYFHATEQYTHGIYLTDGTPNGTYQAVNTSSLGINSMRLNRSLVTPDGIYIPYGDFDHSEELWFCNGTTNGTVMLADIFPGGYPNASSPNYLTYLNGQVFFSARSDTSDYELWVTEGTPTTTKRVKDIRPGKMGSWPEALTAFDNKLFFIASDSLSKGLWYSDGTDSGTQLVVRLNFPSNSTFAVFNNELYFSASNSLTGQELWKTDGTLQGTQLVKDICQGCSSSPKNFVEYNGKLYFQAKDSIAGIELWETDGTANATMLVKDINDGFAGSNPKNFVVHDDILYFIAETVDNGFQLHKYDSHTGVEETILPPNFNYDACRYSEPITVLDNLYYYANYDSAIGMEIYMLSQTSGTNDQTNSLAFLVFPNPTQSVLNITIEQPILGSLLNIYDVTGSILLSMELHNLHVQLNTDSYSSGVYVAEVITTKGVQRVKWMKM